MSPRPASGRRHLSTSPFNAPEVDQTTYEVGELVTSDRHGLGRVVSVDVDEDQRQTSVVVDYRGGGLRRTSLPSRSISRLDE